MNAGEDGYVPELLEATPEERLLEAGLERLLGRDSADLAARLAARLEERELASEPGRASDRSDAGGTQQPGLRLAGAASDSGGAEERGAERFSQPAAEAPDGSARRRPARQLAAIAAGVLGAVTLGAGAALWLQRGGAATPSGASAPAGVAQSDANPAAVGEATRGATPSGGSSSVDGALPPVRPEPARPLFAATAEPAVLRWEAAGEAPVRGSRLEAGQALVLERGETSVLRFDELDATLEVSGPALVRLGAAAVDGRSEPVAHVDVRLGRVWVRGADASQLLLASRWTTARSFKGAEVLFALETGSAADLPQSRAELAAWFEQVPQLPPAELDFEIAVERGEAQVTYGPYAEMLGSGARRRPRTRPTLPRQVGLDDENRLRGLVQSLVEGGRLAGLGNAWAFERNVERRIALSGAIEADARRWEIVGPLIYEQFQADKTDNEARLWLLDLLAWDRLPASLELAEELWMAAPEVFNDELLVSLAERGGWAFEQELRAIAESARVEPLRRARALAYLAPRSESAARQSLLNELDAALARTLEIGGLVGGLQVRQALAAAGVLALLGQPDRFDALVGRAATDAEYALEGRSDPKDAVDGARRQVLFLEFYRDWVKRAYEADSIPQLGFVEERAWAYVMGRQGLTTPAELRARLLELRQPLRLR